MKEPSNQTIADLIDFWKLDTKGFSDFVFITEATAPKEVFNIIPDYYAFGFAREGYFELEIDGQFHHFSRSVLFVHRPNQVIRNVKASESIKLYMVCFKPSFLGVLNENIFTVKNKSFLSDGVASYIPLAKKDYKRLSYIFKHIYTLYKSLQKKTREYFARSLTSVLIYETDDILNKYIEGSDVVINQTDKLVLGFKQLVYANYIHERTVSFYASMLNISPSHLYATVKNRTGHSPSHFIHLQLLNEAKRLLNYSDLSISEIAYRLNFSSPYSFSKFFKNQTNLSPAKYRLSVIGF